MPAFSTRIHAYLHYCLAIFLLASPFWGRFAGPNAETWVAVGFGVAIVIYGLITDNELGIFRRLQMPLHLWIDAFAGVVVATSPWVFSFDERVWIPHVVAGVLLLALAIGSHTIPGYDRRSPTRTALD